MTFPIEKITQNMLAGDVRELLNKSLTSGDSYGSLSNAATSVQTIPTDTWTTVSLDTLSYNQLGVANSAGVLTFPDDAIGVYQLSYGVEWKNDASELANHRRKMRLLVSNTAIPSGIGLGYASESLFIEDMGDLSSVSVQAGATFLALTGTTPTIALQVHQNSGQSIDIQRGVFQNTKLAFCRVGDLIT